MVVGRMIQQKINYGRNYFIRLSDYSLLFRMANRTFAYGYNIYRNMILRAKNDGIRYSLNMDEQVATVKKCIDMEREGEVVIPEWFFHEGIVYRVTKIGRDAFSWCEKLTAIAIPESVNSIEWGAFRFCCSLKSINIPKSVTSIADGAFYRCSSITAINLPEGITSIGECAFFCCRSLEDINIPKSVTNIGNAAFSGCHNLKDINIPKIITSIADGAFCGCDSLTTIIIPEGVTSIGKLAFYDCSSLTSITLPEGMTSIGRKAFSGCSSLTNINIPAGVESIGSGAFFDCSCLTAIAVTEGNTVYDSREGCNAIIETSSNTLIQGCAKTVIPESVTRIGDGAFYGCDSLKDINIPKSVTSIGKFAFSGLTSILIPKSVKNIGEYAFHGTGVTYLTILGKPTIEENAFTSCKKLTDIYCYSTEVPPANDETFGNINEFGEFDPSHLTLHVPESAMEQYKNTAPWNRFGKIVAIK